MRLVVFLLYSNGHWFVINNPPVILFAVCIVFFTLILSALAYYVAATESIRNPDISKVRNGYYFIEAIRFFAVMLCLKRQQLDFHEILLWIYLVTESRFWGIPKIEVLHPFFIFAHISRVKTFPSMLDIVYSAAVKGFSL